LRWQCWRLRSHIVEFLPDKHTPGQTHYTCKQIKNTQHGQPMRMQTNLHVHEQTHDLTMEQPTTTAQRGDNGSNRQLAATAPIDRVRYGAVFCHWHQQGQQIPICTKPMAMITTPAMTNNSNNIRNDGNNDRQTRPIRKQTPKTTQHQRLHFQPQWWTSITIARSFLSLGVDMLWQGTSALHVPAGTVIWMLSCANMVNWRGAARRHTDFLKNTSRNLTATIRLFANVGLATPNSMQKI